MKPGLLLVIIFYGFLLFYFPGFLVAQNNTSSPYSMFGLGDIETNGNIRSSGMGGVGIALESKSSLNTVNPASYIGIDSMLFLFDIGLMGKFSTIKSATQQDFVNDMNISSILFGFRAKKWWAVSFGILPYSSIGYRFDSERVIEGTNNPYQSTIEGEGGINKFYLGNSFKIWNNLSIGIHASLLLGSLGVNESSQIALGKQFYVLNTESSYYLYNFFFDYGLQYHFEINKIAYSIGTTFSNKQKLSSFYDTRTYLQTGEKLNYEINSTKDIIIPQSAGIGICIQIPDKLTIAADYLVQDWTENTFTKTDANFKMSQSIRMGAEYNPLRRIGSSYLSFIDYRIGAYYSDLYYELYGIPIVEKGFSFGLGLPLGKTKVDLSLEYAIKGTTQNGLVEESFYKLKVGFSLRQFWFQRRKYR